MSSSLLERIAALPADKRALLADMLQSPPEPIAVVGMGCRFPGGADSPAAFWELLATGGDAICEIPPARWDIGQYYNPDSDTPGSVVSRYGGFLQHDVAAFDAAFFGIAPREAAQMDPQQRLLLEVVHEALEHAAIAPASLAGSTGGVFVGAGQIDYAQWQWHAPTGLDIYSGTGVASNVLAGRVAYLYDLRGPAVVVDTACSSSLVAMHLACQSLRQRECDTALAGGVSLMLSPLTYIAPSRMRMLAPDGRSKTFDAAADGIVMGEGCGMVVLKRLSDAQASGDHIWGVIHGTAINQDGRSNGLTAPNVLAQQAVIRQALAQARLQPGAISYIEAHGTGTPLGDPIELEALTAVYGQASTLPCVVGSVKTNIGHLAAAAGVAGLIKLLLAMHHQTIPQHLHFQRLNPNIRLEQTRFRIPTRPQPWQPAADGPPRVAALSSFGWSGTNAHAIVAAKEHAAGSREHADSPPPCSTLNAQCSILPLSARSPAALDALAARYADYLSAAEAAGTPPALADICGTASTGRSHYHHRLAVVASSSAELRDKLATGDWLRGQILSRQSPPVVFLFSGQGAQYVGMGRQLYATQPVFRQALDTCDQLLRSLLDVPLLDLLYPPPDAATDERAALLQQTAYTQPALFALEYALAHLWQHWGVQPAAVAGHSLGEYVAACVAGVFDLESGLRLVAERGRLMQALPTEPVGAMAAIFAPPEAVQRAIAPYGDVAIAAINGWQEVVISGVAAAVDAVLAHFAERDIRGRRLGVSHAFHSPVLKPMLDEWQQFAAGFSYQPPRIPLISNRDGQPLAGFDSSSAWAAYWRQHTRQPVQFAACLETLYRQGYRLMLEVGPGSTLVGLGQRWQADAPATPDDTPARWLPSLPRQPTPDNPTPENPTPENPTADQDDQACLRASLGALYTAGVSLDWAGVLAGVSWRRVPLPTYPFQRERHWIAHSRLPNGIALDSDSSPPAEPRHDGLPFPGRRLDSPLLTGTVFETRLTASLPLLAAHQVYGRVVVPAAAYVALLLAAADQAMPASARYRLDHVTIQAPLVLAEAVPQAVQTALLPASPAQNGQHPPAQTPAEFHIFSRPANQSSDTAPWQTHISGLLHADQSSDTAPPAPPTLPDGAALEAEGWQMLPGADYYRLLHQRGMQSGPPYHLLRQVWRRDGAAWGQLAPGDARDRTALLDACLQVYGLALPGALADSETGSESDPAGLYLPLGWEALTLSAPLETVRWSYARLRDSAPADSYLCDITMLDGQGTPVAALQGLLLRRTPTRAEPLDTWLYDLVWQPVPAPAESEPLAGPWLLVPATSDHPTAALLVARLESLGIASLLAPPEEAARLLAETAEPLRQVVYLADTAPPLPEHWTPAALHAYQQQQISAVLHLVQAAVQRPHQPMPRLWLLTCGAQAATPDVNRVQVEQAPLYGLGTALAHEHPDLFAASIDLNPAAAPVQHVHDMLAAMHLAHIHREDRIAIRGGRCLVARLQPHTGAPPVQAPAPSAALPESATLTSGTPGLLDSLHYAPASRRAPGPGEVEIDVQSSGLNFRDVLQALGQMPPTADTRLGSELAGVVVRCGAGVAHLSPGSRVMGIAAGSFSRFATTDARLVVPVPAHFSLEAAASIPVAYLTAWYALHHLASIQPGQHILIHAAAGGVGLAAVALAQQAGAEIIATAGNPQKRAALRHLGIQRVYDSRALDYAAAIAADLQATGSPGLDLVLAAVTGDHQQRSLELLRPGGVYLEMGKADSPPPAQRAAANPQARYLPFDLGEIITHQPALIQTMLHEIAQALAAGNLPLLPRRVFPAAEVQQAFRSMAQAQHIGKIVVAQQSPRPLPVSAEGTYLLTGGTGGLGLAVARWLADQGAGALLLVGRRALANLPADTRQTMQAIQTQGTRLVYLQADVSDPAAVAGLLAHIDTTDLPPLRGILHTAGVLDDGVVVQQTWPRCERVFAPKLAGAWNLHRHTLHRPLDMFVLFSAAAVVLGSPGQATYAAANAFLDALAQHRRVLGLPATSINWGAWAERGMAAAQGERSQQRHASLGMQSLSPQQGISLLERIVQANPPQQTALALHWPTLLQRYAPGDEPALLRTLATSTHLPANPANPANPASHASPGAAASTGAVRRQLATLPPAEQRSLLLARLSARVSRMLGSDPTRPLDVHQPLYELGLDSLMAVELSNWIKTELHITLPMIELLQGPDMQRLTDLLLARLSAEDTAADDGQAQEDTIEEGTL